MHERTSYEIVRDSSASPERLFQVLYDATRWPDWAPLVTTGGWVDAGVVGVDAVRRVGSRGFEMRERITVHEPPSRHGYTFVSRTPVEDYQALVRIEPTVDGSRVTWTGSAVANGLRAKAYMAFVRWYIGRTASALVRHAAA